MRARYICLLFIVLLLGCSTEVVILDKTPTPTGESTSTPIVTMMTADLSTHTPDKESQGEYHYVPPEIHPLLLPLVIEEWPAFGKDELRYNSDDIQPFRIDLQKNEQPEFLPEDMVAGDLRFGMTQQEIVDSVGLPDVVYSYVEDATAYQYLELHYANGNILWLHDTYDQPTSFFLNSANIVADLPGPRGIRLGDSMNEVLQSFKIDPPNDEEGVDFPGTMTLYAQHWMLYEEPNTMRALAPSGQIESSEYYSWDDPADAKMFIRYDYPGEPYTMEDLLNGDKEYPFLSMYFCSFTIQNDRVIAYYWSSGARAE